MGTAPDHKKKPNKPTPQWVKDKFIIYYPHETEMVSLYRAYSEGPFKLHPEEIKSGRFINKDTLSKEYKMGFIKLSFGARVVLQKLNWI